GSTAATTVSGIAKTASTAPVTAASTVAVAPDGLTAGLGLGLGGCCGVGSAGPSTTDQAAIQPADIVNGKQQATITVDGYGYSPQILVIQRGLETKITFDVRQATGCSGKAYIPESGLQIDLEKDGSLPAFVAAEDFSISCWMNMLGMNVKVVDDLGKVDLQAIQDEVANSLPAGGGGCCG
ncbi:MAG TPA: heavy metal transporter, partial [Clostridia bacterium]